MHITFLRMAWLAPLLLSTVASAEISYTGTFAADDDMFTVSFSLAAPANITVRTWSFAGGTNANGDVIAAGGFAPVTSLFDSAGNLLAFDAGGVAPGACGARAVDPATGFCLDGYVNGIFPAGDYMVVLTEWDSTPNGPTFADGFVEQGNGNFTGGPFLLNAGPGFQRTGEWALDIPGVAAPEPSFTALSGMLILVLRFAAVRIKRRPWREHMMKTIWLATAFLVPLTSWATTAHVAADTYVSSANPTLNYGNLTTLNIGGGNSALIGLDLSPLPAGLTAVNIQRATLTMFVNKVFTAGALDIAQVTGNWMESAVTYSTQPAAGVPFHTNVPVNVSGVYVTFDITSLMQQWVTGTAQNFGVLITAAALQPNTVVALDSKESTSTSHPAYAEVTLVSMGPQGPAGPAGATGLQGIQGSQGPQGVPGAQGAQGQGVKWRGAWNSGTTYSANDAVTFQGGSWISLGGPPPPTCVPGQPCAIPINLSIPPNTNPVWWALMAASGAPGTPGQTVLAYAGQSCPSGQSVTGFDGKGNIQCGSTAPTCTTTTYTATITSYTQSGSFATFGIPIEMWPSGTNYLGTGSCQASVDGPGPPPQAAQNTGAGADCPIDDSEGCPGWRNARVVAGFSSCIILAIPNPSCNSLAAVSRLDGTFPACSSGASTGSHSTATVQVVCTP